MRFLNIKPIYINECDIKLNDELSFSKSSSTDNKPNSQIGNSISDPNLSKALHQEDIQAQEVKAAPNTFYVCRHKPMLDSLRRNQKKLTGDFALCTPDKDTYIKWKLAFKSPLEAKKLYSPDLMESSFQFSSLGSSSNSDKNGQLTENGSMSVDTNSPASPCSDDTVSPGPSYDLTSAYRGIVEGGGTSLCTPILERGESSGSNHEAAVEHISNDFLVDSTSEMLDKKAVMNINAFVPHPAKSHNINGEYHPNADDPESLDITADSNHDTASGMPITSQPLDFNVPNTNYQDLLDGKLFLKNSQSIQTCKNSYMCN